MTHPLAHNLTSDDTVTFATTSDHNGVLFMTLPEDVRHFRTMTHFFAMRRHVGCEVTIHDRKGTHTRQATCEEFGDALLTLHDMWDNVVVGMPTPTIDPTDAECVMGELSTYTSENCPVCGRVYSGADISAHLRTHTDSERKRAHVMNLRIKTAKWDAVLEQTTGVVHSYMSESEGLTDTTEAANAPGAKWTTLRDSHIQEMKDAYTVGRGGTNPKYTYFWRQGRTREERVAKLAQWIRTAHLSAVLRTLNQDVLKQRRNLTVAQALGFETTPRGKWDGVEGCEGIGLIRRYKTTVSGQVVEVTRLPDWSGLYLTRAQ